MLVRVHDPESQQVFLVEIQPNGQVTRWEPETEHSEVGGGDGLPVQAG